MTDVKAQSEDHAPDQPHPSTFSPATFALLIVLAIFGAIIGIQVDPAARGDTEHVDHRRVGCDDPGATPPEALCPLPLRSRPEPRAEQHFGRNIWCGQQPPCTNWCPVSSWLRRPDIADAGRRGTGDAAGCVSALPDV